MGDGKKCQACGCEATEAAAAACPLGEWCELRMDRLGAAFPPPHEAVDTGNTPMTGDFE